MSKLFPKNTILLKSGRILILSKNYEESVMLKKVGGALFLLLCMLVSFASDCDNFPIDPINDYGHIMVTHASPDLANVDVHVSDIVLEDQSYPNSTSYIMLDEGSHKVSLTPKGMDDILLETDIEL
jgi:hypothetical protein